MPVSQFLCIVQNLLFIFDFVESTNGSMETSLMLTRLRDLTWWYLSISTSVAKHKLFFKISWTFSSDVFHVSFWVSWRPSVWRLVLRDLSSSSTSFAETSSGSKISFSVDLILFSNLVMSFFCFLIPRQAGFA